jgi:hypothetical protein
MKWHCFITPSVYLSYFLYIWQNSSKFISLKFIKWIFLIFYFTDFLHSYGSSCLFICFTYLSYFLAATETSNMCMLIVCGVVWLFVMQLWNYTCIKYILYRDNFKYVQPICKVCHDLNKFNLRHIKKIDISS